MSTVMPLGDRVLLQKKKKQQGNSSIIIPETAQETSQIATVVAVGKGKMIDGKLVELYVKPGQDIIYGKYSGTEVEMNGEKYLIVREDDILAVIE